MLIRKLQLRIYKIVNIINSLYTANLMKQASMKEAMLEAFSYNSSIREREKMKWKKQRLYYFIETNKHTNKTKQNHWVDILPSHKIPDKFKNGSREQFPPLFPPTPIGSRMFTINKPIC